MGANFIYSHRQALSKHAWRLDSSDDDPVIAKMFSWISKCESDNFDTLAITLSTSLKLQFGGIK